MKPDTAPTPRPGRRSRRKRPAPPGLILADGVYLLAEVARRLGTGWRGRWALEEAGLRTVTFRGKKVVLGRDVLALFEKMAGEQAGDTKLCQ
jgi:hypothetical protein